MRGDIYDAALEVAIELAEQYGAPQSQTLALRRIALGLRTLPQALLLMPRVGKPPPKRSGRVQRKPTTRSKSRK